jgi:hypothetical protein
VDETREGGGADNPAAADFAAIHYELLSLFAPFRPALEKNIPNANPKPITAQIKLFIPSLHHSITP